jgi:hypothetical protein
MINTNPLQNNNILQVSIKGSSVEFYDPNNLSNSCNITFKKTLRLPDDNKIYPLPPDLGDFPLCRVDDYLDKVPEEWKSHGGVFMPMWQREAMWVNFELRDHHYPKAVKIAVGKVNAIDGELWDNELKSQPQQNYVVMGLQQWIDGIAAGNGYIKQFVAMPLGEGYTVEHQVTGEETSGGLQIMVVDSKDRNKRIYNMRGECDRTLPMPYMPRGRGGRGGSRGGSRGGMKKCSKRSRSRSPDRSLDRSEAREMGLSAGGKMKQKIIKDSYGIDHWDQTCFARVYVHIVNNKMYTEITGKRAPETPIDARTYSTSGYPWYDMYEEDVEGVAPSQVLSTIKTVKEMDQEKYAWPKQDDSTVHISANQVGQATHKYFNK